MKLSRHLALFVCAILSALAVCGNTHLSGVQASNTGNQDHRLYSWKRQIAYLNPDRTPFLQMQMKMREEKVTDYEYKVFERDHPDRWVRLNEALDNSETAVDVDDATGLNIDDVLLLPVTNEVMLVTGISGNTLTVTRGYLGTTATASATNAWIKRLFSREPENGLAAPITTTATTTVTNFTQIFKGTYGTTGTREAMQFRTNPHSMREERKLAMQRYKEDMEQAMLWGIKREVYDATNGAYTHFTGGINQFVSTNRIDAEGGVGFGDISYWMNVTTRFGGKDKVWFCGRDARQQMDSLGLEYRRITGKATKMGFKVDGLQSNFGSAMVVTHHGLTNAHAGHLMVVDPGHASIARLRSIKHEKNIQDNGRDGKEHQFLSEHGAYLDTEKAHAVIYNLTANLV